MHKAILQILYGSVHGGEERSLQISSMLFSKQWGLMCIFILVCTKSSTMTVGGKNRLIFTFSPFCGLFVDVEIFFFYTCFFLLTFSVHITANHEGILKKALFWAVWYQNTGSVVYVDSNSYIIYYLLFCCWIYVRSMEKVFITFFFSLFSGMLREGVFALHYIALERL